MSRRATVFLLIVTMLAVGVAVLLMSPGQDERTQTIEQAASVEKRVAGGGALSSVATTGHAMDTDPAPATDDCPHKMTLDEMRTYEKEQQAHFKAVGKQLAESNEAEYVLAAALLLQGEPGKVSTELIDRAHRLAPASPLVAWNMLRTCRDQEILDCDMAWVEANAIRADGDNGAVWMEIAMLRLAGEKSDDALTMVRQAIAAPRFDSYFIEHALLIERALSTGGDSSYTERMITGVGYSAALVVSYYAITRFCRTVEEANVDWIDLCYQIGEKMFVDGRVLLDQAIGVSLMKIAASQTHDVERAAALVERESEFRERYQDLMVDTATQNLLLNDESVLRQYVENLATFGEFEALTRLREEAARLRKTDGYDQCNFVNPHAIR